MKKLSALLLILVMAIAMGLTGCGSGDDENNNDDAVGDDDRMVVGFIYVGSIGDGGFTYAHNEGRKYLDEQMGDQVRTIYQESVVESKEDVISVGKNMIDQGAEIIFATSFGFMEGINELAEMYPDVKFMHFSGYMMNDTNFGNYFGAMEEPRYLSGIVAGLKTETNKIGYVAAFPLTELKIGINAFTLGVQSVNPDATVHVVWTNSWEDATKEREAAVSLLESGCDVIAQHVDTTGPMLAAQEKGVWSVGYNSDASEAAPETFMTAPIWNHGVFLVDQVQQVLNGTWEPISYYGDMKDGYIGLVPLTTAAPEGAQEAIDKVAQEMSDGTFHVFQGPIKDQAGEIVVPEGKYLNREEIWQIEYLIEGVQGSAE